MERLDRRELLVRAGGLTLAAGTVGVGPALARLGNLPLRELARTLDGTVVARGAAGYAQARLLVSTRFDAVHPKAVVFCESVADVQKTVHWARRHHVHVVARSGGHSYGGYSTTPGVVIDVSRIARVHVDAGGRIATVGAGARLIVAAVSIGGSTTPSTEGATSASRARMRRDTIATAPTVSATQAPAMAMTRVRAGAGAGRGSARVIATSVAAAGGTSALVDP